MNEQNNSAERAFVVIFKPEMEWQGDLIVQELKDAGLEAYLANRSTTGVWGDVEPLAKLEVLVPEVDADRGREIIDAFFRERGLVSEAELDKDAEETEKELEE
jgi:hypothetical protein